MINCFNRISIFKRLIILISLGFCIGFFALSFFSYHFLKNNFYTTYVNFFHNEHSVLQEIIDKYGVNISSELNEEVISEPKADDYKYYVEIKSPSDQLILKTPNMDKIIEKPNKLNNNSNKLLFFKKNNKTFALFNGTLDDKHDAYNVRILLDITMYSKILMNFKNYIVIISFILTVIFILFGAVLIKLGLNPLDFFVKKISKITENTLEPMQLKQLPYELELLLTEINQLILRTKESYENVSSFSSNIAHELRTPINNLMISNEIFLMKKNKNTEIKQHILSNSEEYQRLSNLIDKLLLLARLNSSQKKMTKYSLDLSNEVAKVVDFHEAIAEEKNIAIIQSVSGLIDADKDLFHNALSNVLTNSIKYSPKNTTITIISNSIENFITLSISDQGPGIPKNELSKMTSRFYQYHKDNTSQKLGLGLGLSIVKSIMFALDGTMDITLNKLTGMTVCLSFRKIAKS